MKPTSESLAYFAEPAPMTAVGTLAGPLPRGVLATARTIQGVMMHPFHAALYDTPLPGDAEAQLANRSARAILERIHALDGRPLVESRPPERRTIGNCRHFTTLFTALLRAQGIPARSRCGFGTYFTPGQYADHWVCEYWETEASRWVLADAQIDGVQKKALGITLDTLDLGREDFWVAGQAWKGCRSGEIDPEHCGILDMWGLWFVLGNVLRDAAALCKTELLPWDDWGLMGVELDDFSDGDFALVDRVAALTAETNHDTAELRALVRSHEELCVPAKILSHQPSPHAVDVGALLAED